MSHASAISARPTPWSPATSSSFARRSRRSGGASSISAPIHPPPSGDQLSGVMSSLMHWSSVPSKNGSSRPEMHLDLVHDERVGEEALEEVERRGEEVRHPEVAHLAARAERVERLGDLLGVHEQVGPVELVEVDRLDPQPRERAVGARENVLGGEVVPPGRPSGSFGKRMPHFVAIVVALRSSGDSFRSSPWSVSHPPRA